MKKKFYEEPESFYVIGCSTAVCNSSATVSDMVVEDTIGGDVLF